MPGRTPAEAFLHFVEPIQQAASCLGPVKIVASPGGRSNPHADHAWSLNGALGKSFAGGWHFEAQMYYRIEEQPFSRTWKVRTLGYRYQLALRGTHLWRIHWHPTVNSGYHLPHLHLNLGTPGEIPTPDLSAHHPTGRMTFEEAIEWVFLRGIEPSRDDWEDVLEGSRSVHIEHRTWHTKPPA